MKNLKYLIGTVLVSVASVGLFVACSDDGDSTSCVMDSECLEGEVCEAQFCTATCTEDADCGIGEVCGMRVNGDGMVCQLDSTNANANANTGMCTTNEECGADGVCVEGMCQTPNANMGDPVFAFTVTDVTTAEGGCTGDDPGSDIQAVELQDNTGNTLGWAEFIADGTVGDHTEQNLALFDGSAPGLTEGCVDSFSGNVHALGCGGYVGYQFLDGAGDPIALTAEQTIVVYEYGAQCNTGSTADEYNVAICTDKPGLESGNTGSCTTIGSTASAIGTFNVSL